MKEVLAFLHLEEATPSQLEAMAGVKANRGHYTASKVKGCAERLRPDLNNALQYCINADKQASYLPIKRGALSCCQIYCRQHKV